MLSVSLNKTFPSFHSTIQEVKSGIHNVRMSQLNLVDLAGSERQKDTKTVGARLKVK